MRFFEFTGTDETIDKYVILLKNIIGRAEMKKSPAKMNWAGLSNLALKNKIQLAADYETFKAIYDSSPAIQSLVKNFNADGIELDVPGAPDADPQSPQSDQSSQDAVDQTAASAAPQQLSQET
jgi:hypothetical protein|tara:strand:- start:1978 stop:2346 length:369 start_codon:yes stop_codon:yes gene_type:complete